MLKFRHVCPHLWTNLWTNCVHTCGQTGLTFQIEAAVALLALVRENRTMLSSFDGARP